MSDAHEQSLVSDVEIARKRVERYRRGRAWIVTGGVFASWLLIGGITLGMVTNAIGVDLGAGPGGLIVFGIVGLLATAVVAGIWHEIHSEEIKDRTDIHFPKTTHVSVDERYQRLISTIQRIR